MPAHERAHWYTAHVPAGKPERKCTMCERKRERVGERETESATNTKKNRHVYKVWHVGLLIVTTSILFCYTAHSTSSMFIEGELAGFIQATVSPEIPFSHRHIKKINNYFVRWMTTKWILKTSNNAIHRIPDTDEWNNRIKSTHTHTPSNVGRQWERTRKGRDKQQTSTK